MKVLSRFCITIILSLTAVFPAWGAGSLSGTVSYAGKQEGSTYVAVFTSPLSCSSSNPEPFKVTQPAASGAYELTGLPDGNYYVAAVKITCGNDCSMVATDPWGIFNGCTDIKPITITGNPVAGIDMTLVDGTRNAPNPLVSKETSYYLGVTGNATGSIGFTKSYSDLSYFGFSVTGDGGAGREGHGLACVEAILPFGTHSPPLKFLPPKVGQTWIDQGSSNSYVIDSTAVVQSITESVTVAAGTFANCAHVREDLVWPGGYDRIRYMVAYDRWLCPGIGPAKLIITDNFGGRYFGELTTYKVNNVDASDYFPLEVGDQWTFRMDDGRSATWKVNAIAPDVMIDSKPANSTQQKTASFSFSSSIPTATFECKLDSFSFTPCASPSTYFNLAAGSHTFTVRAKDSAGYYSVDPPSYTWTINLQVKPGDCDGNGGISIDEVQGSINMYLGLKPLSACVDLNNDGVSIDEVQRVINGYLGL